MRRASGNGRNVIERFSLPGAFFEGTLQRSVPLWRAARMFERDPAGDSHEIVERVPQTPRKNAEGTA
jgi:hypothetical protein